MTEEGKPTIEVAKGFNLIATVGLEVEEDKKMGISLSFGAWFKDTPKEFKIAVLTHVVQTVLERIEGLENENV